MVNMFVLNCLIGILVPAIILLVLFEKIFYVHELGHAIAAKEVGEDAFIILRTLKKSYKTVKNGVDVYYINIKEFKKKFGLAVGGFCSYKDEDNRMFDKEKRLKISKAGYEADISYYIDCLPLYALILAFCETIVYKCSEQTIGDLISGFLLWILFIIAYILQMFENRRNNKKSLDRAMNKVLAAENGSVIKYSISDGAKEHNLDEFQHLLDIVDEKHLITEDSYETNLEWVNSLT